MVKKLLKYEAQYYARTLIIYEIVLFALAIFTRLLMVFETDSIIYYLLQGSSFILFGLAAFACSIMVSVISVYRFYKNLFTSEGYLTFSLPVSTNQHLFAKLFWAVLYNMIVFVSTVLASLITISGDILNETVKAGVFLLENLFKTFKDVPIGLHIVFYIIEFIAIIILSTAGSLLIFYACIAIGQTAKKNRILLSVAVYFGYMMLSEMIGTFISIIMSIFATSELFITMFEKIGEFINNHPFEFVHIIMIISIVSSILVAAVCYFITHRIITRKLNLE